MNLNGQNSKNTKTILNGKPLYAYDTSKKIRYEKHIVKHKEEVQKWRSKDASILKPLLFLFALIILLAIIACLVGIVFS